MHIPINRTLLLPEATCLFKAVPCFKLPQIHADYPNIYEKNASWVSKYLPFDSVSDSQIFFEARIPMWDSLIYPRGNKDRVFQSSCVTSLMFKVDDAAFLEEALFERVRSNWFGENKFGAAFSHIFGEMKDGMSLPGYNRYIQEWQNWFIHTKKENEFREKMEIPDVETCLDIRRLSVGLRPYIAYIEYVMSANLNALAIEDVRFNEAGSLAVEHAMLVNDLFSLGREYFSGDLFNPIISLLYVHQYDLQGAIDNLLDRISKADKLLFEKSQVLQASYTGYPEQKAVQLFVDTLGTFCAGNLRWSHETTRYHGHGYAWNGLRAGKMVVSPQCMNIEAH